MTTDEGSEPGTDDASKHTFSSAGLFESGPQPEAGAAELTPAKTPEQIQNEAINSVLAGYDPFDPVIELRELRSRNPEPTLEQQALAPAQRAEAVRSLAASYRSEIDAYKAALVQQYQGVSQTINILDLRVSARPDSSFDELWDEVRGGAPADRLTAAQLVNFYQGLQQMPDRLAPSAP